MVLTEPYVSRVGCITINGHSYNFSSSGWGLAQSSQRLKKSPLDLTVGSKASTYWESNPLFIQVLIEKSLIFKKIIALWEK